MISAFLMLICLACKSVPENWHICVNKGLTYLHFNATALRELLEGVQATEIGYPPEMGEGYN